MFSRVMRVTNVTPMAMNRGMRTSILFFAILLTKIGFAQQAEVSYQSSSHLYLKVDDGARFDVDSLEIDGHWLPVIATSSRSVVVEKKELDFETGAIFTVRLPEVEGADLTPELPLDQEAVNEEVQVNVSGDPLAEVEKKEVSQHFRARLGSDYYANWANGDAMQRTAQRFSLSYDRGHPDRGQFTWNSRGIARQYLSDGNTRWNMYELSGSYEQNALKATLGRQVPRFAASLGSIDGMTLTAKTPLQLHAIAGYRPNYQNFGLQMDQPVFGVFVSNPVPWSKRKVTSSLGWATFMGTDASGAKGIDRQLIYSQWSIVWNQKLSLHSSFELDTYQKFDGGNVERKIVPTGVFASLNYRLSKNARLFLSYDNRAPRIFYQQFDAELEQLLFNLGIQQGYRLRYSHRVNQHLRLSLSGTVRSQSTSPSAFSMLSIQARYRLPISKMGSFYAQFSTSSAPSYTTQISLIQYRNTWGEHGNYRIYLRQLHYGYEGAAIATSDRIYFGAETSRRFADLEAFTRLELSSRNGQIYPGVQIGMNYRIRKK